MPAISRDRVIEMLRSFAKGTYQALLPEVAGAAAFYLQRSSPPRQKKTPNPSIPKPPRNRYPKIAGRKR